MSRRQQNRESVDGSSASEGNTVITLQLTSIQVIFLTSVLAVSIASLAAVYTAQLSNLTGSVTSQAPAEGDDSAPITKKEYDSFVHYFREELKIMQIDYSNMAGETNRQLVASADKLKRQEIHGGAVYTTWGTITCGDKSETVYTGTAVEGKAGYYCLPEGANRANPLSKEPAEADLLPVAESSYKCAQCLSVRRPALTIIPATTHCPRWWTKEHDGVLVFPNFSQSSTSAYECVDESDKSSLPEKFTTVRADCSTPKNCPPLMCVTCTK